MRRTLSCVPRKPLDLAVIQWPPQSCFAPCAPSPRGSTGLFYACGRQRARAKRRTAPACATRIAGVDEVARLQAFEEPPEFWRIRLLARKTCHARTGSRLVARGDAFVRLDRAVVMLAGFT